nr:putative ribonuclease H-like domain-containing protein [Tanacetum cinerariifolium]
MLDKLMYDSWKSRMELYMENQETGYLILESIRNGPLVWPMIEENEEMRRKRVLELSAPEKLQYEANVKATNIFLQDLIVPVFPKGDDPIDAINHMMSFLNTVVTSRYPTNQLKNSSNPRQQAIINDGKVTLQPIQGRITSFVMGTTRTYTLRASGCSSGKQRTIICYNCKGEGHMSKQCTNLRGNMMIHDLRIKCYPTPSNRPTKVEVPKELPKVSMVNTSLKKLKHHLAGFDVVVKERITTTAITEGSWGFKHTKACFGDEIIPFVKALKDLFNTFDQFLIDQLSEVQNVFLQMERAMEQHHLEDNSVSNQSASSFDHYFDLNELKAQLQEKDTIISKLKERIKYLSGNKNMDKVKKDIEEIETINIELDHKVSKLIAKNKHLKQTYKQLYDSIKPTRVRSKEQCDALINQVNQKSVEISDLNVSLKEKDLLITALKNDLRKLKGKALVNDAFTSHSIAPEMLKVDVEPLAPKLLNNRTAHSDYLRHTQEQAAILKEVVKQIKSQNPLNNFLDHACQYTKRIQELLIIIRQTCPCINSLRNACPLTRITTTTEVPSRKPISLETDTPKHVVTLLYSRKPRKSKTTDHVSKSKFIQIVLWYLDSGCSKHMTGDRSQLTNFFNKFLRPSVFCLCMGKSKKKPHKPKSGDTNQEKLYLLHMDLCGPMRVASVSGKKYILVIPDDYSRFTWVKCLCSKDEALDFIIKFIKMIQVRLKIPIRRIKTDNETEFVNQTLREYYKQVGISHETSVARSPQQNGIIKRRKCTLTKASRTIDSYEVPANDATSGTTSDGTGKKKGRIVTLTTDDMQKRKNDVKARTTLLLSLPDEHQ